MPFKENGGQTKFSEIASEFGGRKPHRMREYYKGGRWIQENSVTIKVTPYGLEISDNALQYKSAPISFAANEKYLVKCNAIPLYGDYLFANGNFAGGYIIITSVVTYAVRYPELFSALSDSEKEFYDDVYEIRGNAAHSYPVSVDESMMASAAGQAGMSVENSAFIRGQNYMYRADEKYGLGGNATVINPSNIPFDANRTYSDPLYGEGTEVKFSNYHDSFSGVDDALRQTSNQTSRTTANAENTSFMTSKITTKGTSFNTSFNTTISYSQTTSFLTHVGPDYSGTDITTSRNTSWTQQESTSRNTGRSTNKTTYFSTSRGTSALTVFNTSFNTEYTFWN